jgi:hypothetical protein
MIATPRKLGGIGALILSIMLIAGTASGELLTKKSLSLEDAKKVAAGAAAEARKNKWNLDIAIVDDGGHRSGRLEPRWYSSGRQKLLKMLSMGGCTRSCHTRTLSPGRADC